MRILAFTSEPEYYTPLSECPDHSVLFAEYQDSRARRLWVACAPQLILLDVFRLGATADALFSEFESLWPDKIPPVLVVCPPQGWEVAHEWLDRGAYDFLIEPLNCRLVSARLTAIEKHLNESVSAPSFRTGSAPQQLAAEISPKSRSESDEAPGNLSPKTAVSEDDVPTSPDDGNGRGMIHVESRFFHNRESLFQTIFERAAIGLVLADFDGRFVRVNRTFAEWLGYTPEELEGRQIAEFSHPDDVVREIKEFTTLVTGEKDSIVFEKRYRHKDGRMLWGRLHVLILERYSDKRGLGFAMVEDITTEKDVAGKLGEMEIRWNKLLDNAPDLFFLADADARLLYVNKITVDELTMDDVIGKRCTTWVHPDDCELFEEHFRRAVETGKPQRFVDRDIFGCWWENRLVPLPESGDAAVMGIVSDITDQIHMQELLRKHRELLKRALEADEAERRLFADVVHNQMAQLLTTACMTLEGLQLTLEGHDDSPKTVEQVGTCRKTINEAINLCRRFADTLQTPVLDRFGLIPALREFEQNYRRDYEASLASPAPLPDLQLAIADDIPPLASLLENVLYRGAKVLLNNACEHSRSPWVRLELKHQEPWVVLSVQDGGCGFDAQMGLEAGVDLMLLKQRTELLGGEFHLHTAPNRGTFVEVKLPCIPPSDDGK
ncbi:hypothetical protein JCM19992_10300 [Thermostilla marina]